MSKKILSFEEYVREADRSEEIEKEVTDAGEVENLEDEVEDNGEEVEVAEEESEEVEETEKRLNEAKSIKTYNSLDDFEKIAKIGNVFYLGKDDQFQLSNNKDYFKVVGKKTDGTLVVSRTTSNNKFTIGADRYDEKVHLVKESVVKESEEAEEEVAKAVSEMLKETYESACNEAMAYESDDYEEHTIESYMKEMASLNASMMMETYESACKEGKEGEMTREMYEAACESMKESYAKKMDEMKESYEEVQSTEETEEEA